jgi:hypothetical protein
MKTVSRGSTINQELESVSAAVQQEGNEQEEIKAEFRRILSARREVFELHFKRCLGLYGVICQLNDQWRVAVFRGEEPQNADEDRGFKELFERWLSLSDRVRQRAEFYERHCQKFDWRLHNDLRLYTQEARRTLQEWQPARLSTAKAFRTRTVSKEEAALLGFAVND